MIGETMSMETRCLMVEREREEDMLTSFRNFKDELSGAFGSLVAAPPDALSLSIN